MVEGYEGRPGAGKTATAVSKLWQAKTRGRPVYANIPLIYRCKVPIERRWKGFDPEKALRWNPELRDGNGDVEPTNSKNQHLPVFWADGFLKSLPEVLALDNAIVLLDEVHMWMSADAWKEIPFEVRRYLAQQRKRGIDIWWTAQSNSRVFNVIRELTACLWSCQRYGPLSVLEGRDPESKEGMGKRYHFMTPAVWDLYDTEYEVGDSKGEEAGRVSRNKKYDKRRAEREAQTANPRRLLRVADEFGGVRYCYEMPEPEPIPGPLDGLRLDALREWAKQELWESKEPALELF